MSHNSGFAGTAASPRGAEGPTGGSGDLNDEAAIAAALGVTCELRKRAEEAAAVARAATRAKAAQLAWKSPAEWHGSRPDLPSTRDGGHTFVTWNLAGAWSRVSSKDPRRRQNRVDDILHACHFLGVAVAVFPESGLGYDDEQGEKMVASWAQRSGCPARIWNAVPVHEAAGLGASGRRRRASPWWPSAPGRRAPAPCGGGRTAGASSWSSP
jgi:hypothetical protein